MNIAYLEEFVSLAETLSFTQTARLFYTNRSVISRHVAALEDEFGVRLLERDRHSVKLTEQGEIFCNEARALVKSYRRLQRNTRLAAERGKHIVRVGYLRNASRPFIVRFSRYVKARDSKLVLAFSDMPYDELRHAMNAGRVDVAFTMDVGQGIPDDYNHELVYRDRFYVMVSAESELAQHTDGIDRKLLAGHELLLADSFESPDLHGFLYGMLGSTASKIGIDYCNDIDTMCLRVQMDGGVALQCGHNVPLAADGIIALPLLGCDSMFSLIGLWRSDMDERAADACIDGILQCHASMEDQREHREIGFALPLLT